LLPLSANASSTWNVKADYPDVPSSCTPGQVYDDGSFTYLCGDDHTLAATYCLVLSEDDGVTLALEVEERITYDQESTLRCYRDAKDNHLYQLLEDVTTETLSDSTNPLENKKYWLEQHQGK